MLANPHDESVSVAAEDWERLQAMSLELARIQAPRWRLWLLTHCLTCYLLQGAMILPGIILLFFHKIDTLILASLLVTFVLAPLLALWKFISVAWSFLGSFVIGPIPVQFTFAFGCCLVIPLILFLYYRQSYRLAVAIRFREWVWEPLICLFLVYPVFLVNAWWTVFIALGFFFR